MEKNEKPDELMDHPLMSTGTTEPGFEKDKKSKLSGKPKIGETNIGEKL